MGAGIRPAAHPTPGTGLRRPWRLAGPSPARQKFSDLATHAKLPVRPGEQFLRASKPVAKQKLTENGDAPAQGWKKRRSAAERKADGSYKPAARAETILLTYNPAPIRTSGGVANARKTQEDTVAITAHLPREIRDRLKILAAGERPP